MKKILSFIVFSFLLLGSLKSWAATCPRIGEINLALPPAGWNFLIGPSLPVENYTFSGAIHSLNGFFYYQQVICRYEVYPSYLGPAFTLISNDRYSEPHEFLPPWDHLSVLHSTLTCMPGDHDPAHCIFQ